MIITIGGVKVSKCQMEKNDDIFRNIDRENYLLLFKIVFSKIRLLAQAVSNFDIFDGYKIKDASKLLRVQYKE